MPEIDLGVNPGFTWAILKVRNQRKRIVVLFGYPVECPEIDT